MADESFDWQGLADSLNANHVPEIILALVGIIAILIVFFYLKDKESGKYKLMVALGIIAGIAMIVLCVTGPMKDKKWTLVLVVIACFALIIRPFRDVHFALVFAVLAMIIAYIGLAGLETSEVEILRTLATGWPRVIAAFVIGGVVYMLLGFLDAMVHAAGKILNAWPILLVLGILCIVEAVCFYQGYDSVIDMIIKLVKDRTATELIALL